MMGKNKKQHIVPTRYLERFAKRNTYNDGYHIGLRQERENRILLEIVSVNDVAFKKNYYDIPSRDDPKYWEHYFATKIEPLYGNALDKIISKIYMTIPGRSAITVEDKLILGKIISFQIMRVPDFLDKQIEKGVEIGKELIDIVCNKFKYILSNEKIEAVKNLDMEKYVSKDITLGAISDENSLNRFSGVLSKKVWVFEINNTTIPFLTSDNPVIIYNLKTNMFSGNGIGGSAEIIFYPITEKLLLQILPKQWFGDKAIEVDGIRLSINESDISFVLKANMIQIHHASSQVFMPPDYLEQLKSISK